MDRSIWIAAFGLNAIWANLTQQARQWWESILGSDKTPDVSIGGTWTASYRGLLIAHILSILGLHVPVHLVRSIFPYLSVIIGNGKAVQRYGAKAYLVPDACSYPSQCVVSSQCTLNFFRVRSQKAHSSNLKSLCRDSFTISAGSKYILWMIQASSARPAHYCSFAFQSPFIHWHTGKVDQIVVKQGCGFKLTQPK